jgi:DNA-binding NtrC family response regulator
MNNENNTERPLRILHFEDSPRDAEIIGERMIAAGFSLEMDWASNEQQFTAFLQSRRYDLFLADYHLPCFDGIAALRMAKSLCPGVPFICVSGAIGEEKAVELLKLGATDYVLKDRLDKLPLTIKRALDEEQGAHSAPAGGGGTSQKQGQIPCAGRGDD